MPQTALYVKVRVQTAPACELLRMSRDAEGVRFECNFTANRRFGRLVVFEKVYAHVLEDSDAVVEWVSGTALVPYFERLGAHKDAFLKVLRDKMRAAMPASSSVR